jgi:OOP family OmpA-OmpF porin
MKFIFVYIVLLTNTLFCELAAQNLVPDAGFENIRRLPKRKDNSVSCTKNWMCPTDYGAADYYHKDGKGNGKAPRNIFGRQKPHAGKAYGGMCIRKKFMEYVSTKLTDTLIKDQVYEVEFYISRAERSIGSVKEFGVLFSDKISMGITGIGIPVQPSVEIIKKHGFRNKRKWMKFSAIYTAKGGETAIIIGHFNHAKIKRFKGFAHYYIDDVSVILQSVEKPTVASNIVEDKDTAMILPQIGETIRLENIFFNSNKSELLVESFNELNLLVVYLNELPNSLIEISGHTDSSGNEEQNRLLSTARAKAVANYLISKNIETNRILYKGYGSSKPISDNESEEGRLQNRRVEFVLKNK